MGPMRWTAAGLTIAAAFLPPVLETRALAWINTARPCATAERGSWCARFADIDVVGLGLRIEGAEFEARGLRATAGTLEAGPSWHGLHVGIADLRLERSRAATLALPRAPVSRQPNDERDATAQDPLPAPPRLALHGIPLTVEIPGTVALPTDPSMRVRLHRTRITVDASGAPKVRTEIDATHGSHWGASVGPITASPVAGWERWSLTGAARLAEGDPVEVNAEVDRAGLRVDARGSNRGILRADVRFAPVPKATIAAERFPLASVSELRISSAIDARDSTFSGHAELTLENGLRVHLERAEIHGLRLDDRRLAKTAVELDRLELDGDVWLRDRSNFSGAVTLGHRGISAHVAATRSSERIAFEAELAPISCQTWLDGLPVALQGPVAGTRLHGDLDGAIRFDAPLSALLEPSDAEPGGHLELRFPFLERCKVERDAAALDFAGLRGPYHHRFVDGRGRTRERVLAHGAPGYVPLSAAGHVPEAFVILEDASFWRHDGFDRGQIERALWHNLRQGRISRGASTISQQAARNLFLGIDRSLGRKLQEAFLTARLEATVPKHRLLEIYLNIIELGPGVHGIEEAAQFYFGRPARALNPLEALHLASLAPAPHRYGERFRSGVVDPTWRAELEHHASRLVQHGYLSPVLLGQVRAAPLRLVPRPPG